ncbi:MAG: enoyl-[acyl-carrier-protein] reductase FabI [Halobacteriovoraceae bacterium]|nr:enoyl-[acyl-carrier-protein] reductase FabI [Halobacteriovoraceae bacterium]|tara:strand:+ start:77868 stop:78638 length:771 start_codon:yes stop_codon:yes gene_type:complete
MGILSGKKVLILGVANERSIAWGIARAMKEQGASLAMSYLNDKLKERVVPLAEEVGADFTFELDVTNEDHLAQMANTVKEKWGKFDCVVHSLAFADKEDLKGTFSQTSRDGFKMAHDISAYSLVSVSHALRALFNEKGSVISMTYHGSQQVVPGYNVMGVAKASLEASSRYLAEDLGPMGIRVNSISAGPIRTLAASGVPGLRKMFDTVEERAPLRRNITTEDVGGAAAFLASDLASGVTGQILYVDSGISTMAMV